AGTVSHSGAGSAGPKFSRSAPPTRSGFRKTLRGRRFSLVEAEGWALNEPPRTEASSDRKRQRERELEPEARRARRSCVIGVAGACREIEVELVIEEDAVAHHSDCAKRMRPDRSYGAARRARRRKNERRGREGKESVGPRSARLEVKRTLESERNEQR